MNGIQIAVIDVQESETGRGRFSVTVKLSEEAHEQTRTFTVFRYFMREKPFAGTVPVTGEFLTKEEYEALCFAQECSLAAVKAVSFLSYGDKTAKQLTDKLRGKGFSKASCERAVRFCEEKGYIREEDQLRRLMEQLCNQKKYGLRRIRQEVWSKGFSNEAVKAVFDECAAELDFGTALRTRIGKLGKQTFFVPEKKKRAVASLLRYGFTYEEIRSALKDLHWDSADADEICEEDETYDA